MGKSKKGFFSIIRVFVLLIVMTLTLITIFNNTITRVIIAEMSSNKIIEDPDDEDFGGVGVFSYDKGEKETM